MAGFLIKGLLFEKSIFEVTDPPLPYQIPYKMLKKLLEKWGLRNFFSTFPKLIQMHSRCIANGPEVSTGPKTMFRGHFGTF